MRTSLVGLARRAHKSGRWWMLPSNATGNVFVGTSLVRLSLTSGMPSRISIPLTLHPAPASYTIRRALSANPQQNPFHFYDDMFGDDDSKDTNGDIDIGKNTVQALRRYTKMRKAGQDLGLDAEKANQILGIVLEDASSLAGTSVVAAYYDGSARFFNGKQYFTGHSLDDEYLEKLVVNFFHFTAKESGRITTVVKDGERGGPAQPGTVRISVLTPAGIRRAEFTNYQDVFKIITAGADLGLYMIMSTT